MASAAACASAWVASPLLQAMVKLVESTWLSMRSP